MGGAQAAKLLTKDEARRIAANIAKLPGVIAEAVIRSVDREAAVLSLVVIGAVVLH